MASPLFTSIVLLQMVGTHSVGHEDAGPSRHADSPPSSTWVETLQQLLGKQDETLRLISHNTASGRQNHWPQDQDSSYQEFLGTCPPVLTQAEEPPQADEWLNTIEQKFRLLGCTDQQKAKFAAH
jgi:hypothetical protein